MRRTTHHTVGHSDSGPTRGPVRGSTRGPVRGPIRGLLLGLAALVAAPATLMSASAQTPAGNDRAISLTVYNQDLAVVRDERTMAVPDGTDWLRFRDVPERIDPTSVHLTPVDEGALGVLEQNYVYDLISPEKILDRYLERTIQVVTEDGRLYEGALLSHSGGRILLGDETGTRGITILMTDKITDMQFPELPEGLITRPTLEWLIAGNGADRRLEVSYMTSGMKWHAEYVAVVAQDDESLGLSGWVSIENRSGATYPEAELQLVAGEPNLVQPPRPDRRRALMAAEMDKATQAPFEEEAFFEYHLYTLDRSSTIKNNETKQLTLFAPARADVEKTYEANPRRYGSKVRVVLEMVNSEDAGLGMPLPKGKVRVFQEDSKGRLQFVGEDLIDHTPRDEEMRILVGHAFDVVVERTETNRRDIGPRAREIDVEIEVRNRKTDEDVAVVVEEDLYGDWTIRNASHEFEKASAQRIEFLVPVKAGEVQTVTFTVRTTW